MITPKNRIQRYYLDSKAQSISLGFTPQKEFNIDPKALKYFLALGYVPGKSTLFKEIECLPGNCVIMPENDSYIQPSGGYYDGLIDTERYKHMSFESLVREGAKIFRKSFENTLSGISEKSIVIPLSGGLDSRLILAFARDFLSDRDIQTFTFGIPGTYDFEFGNLAGKKLSAKHQSFDLQKIEVDEDILLKSAFCTDYNTNIFEPYFFIHLLQNYGKEQHYLSGYTGDGVAGSHFSLDFLREWEYNKECAYYLDHEKVKKTPVDLNTLDISLLDLHAYRNVLSVQEGLFFENHVERYSVNHVIPTGYKFTAPFMTDEIISFLWSVPVENRVGKKLFNRILYHLYPEAFSLPVKQNFGASLASSSGARVRKQVFRAKLALKKYGINPAWKNPMTNYVDFAGKIANKTKFADLMSGLISDIERRDLALGFSPEKILNNHSITNDHSRLIMLLGSLEVILRAKDR